MKSLKLPLIVLLFAATVTAFVLAAITVPKRQLADESTQRFEVRGQIRGFDEDGRTIRIAHEEIPGYMAAMTMPLTVKDPAQLRGLKAGDDVGFQLVVTEDDSWIGRINKIGDGVLPADAGTSLKESQRLQPGETMPDVALVDQHGKPMRLDSLRGKAVLLTFIYTRCPLPNFCPLMSKNFASLQERLEKEFPGKFNLVSVTIDPQFDTPEILAGYSQLWSKNEATWTFATGTPEQVETVGNLFGLTVEPEGGLINHDLRTALISPEGKLVHVWKSNVWTPYEVQRRVREVLTGFEVTDAR